MSSAPAAPAGWTRARERGSLPLIRFMVWMSLRLGRPFTRILLRIIATYFLVFGGRSRRAVVAYLHRCLGRTPTIGEQFGVYFTFASTLHDRVYFLKDRFELFDVKVRGAELFDAHEPAASRGQAGGALLMGAHVGSFEVLRAAGRVRRLRVIMAMYEENARRINGVLQAVDAKAFEDIVPLGRVDSMIALAARLDEGALVGVLADRTLGDELTMRVEFLGAEARFPLGPMRMAAALRQRVFFMVGLYRGGNRYEVCFEPLADFSGLDAAPRDERDRRVRDAVVAYARRVERCCREAPDNWFNFYDFWE